MQPGHDSALLRQYVENHSDEAFAALVARHVNLVYSVALRSVGDSHQAEEITQAVFIILAKKALRLRHDKALSSWLFQTTRLTANNYVRSEARRHGREQEAYMQSRLNEPGSGEAWPQIAPLLDAAVAALREKDRRAIVLRFYEGRNLREIGDALGASEESAKKRVARALEKLQQFFSKRGVHSTTTAIAGAISGNAVCVAPPALVKLAIASATAKGVVGSVSTLALVKGALKIMAWTNAKKTMIAGGFVLLAALMGIIGLDAFHAWRAAHYPDLQGVWEGSMLLEYDGIAVGEASRAHMVLTLVKTNGGYTASSDWIELGRDDVLGQVIYDYPFLSIVQSPSLTWKLRINPDATQMVMDNTSHSKPDPVLFMRTSSPPRPLPHLTARDISPEPGLNLQGYWEGQMSLSQQDDFQGIVKPGHDAAPMNLKIVEQGRGNFRAELDLLEFGVQNMPATGYCQGSQVKFACDCGGGLFQGAMNVDDTELIGSWTISGQSVPADFKRADYRVKQALDNEKDYSFASPNDLQGHWKGSRTGKRGDKKVVVHQALDIAKMPDGSYDATFSFPDGLYVDAPVPVAGFKYNPPNLSVRLKWFYSSFEGTLKNGALVGVWTQRSHWGTNATPLTFERPEAH